MRLNHIRWSTKFALCHFDVSKHDVNAVEPVLVWRNLNLSCLAAHDEFATVWSVIVQRYLDRSPRRIYANDAAQWRAASDARLQTGR